MSTIRRILVATDFSPGGDAAVARAGQLAARYGGELHAIHATPDWSLFSNHTAASQRHYEEITANAEVVMGRALSRLLEEFGIRARGEVHRGKASETIKRAVDSYQPDVLVLGARGEHAPPLAPAALGGTTLKLITQVAAPVLVVREQRCVPYNIALAAVRDAGERSGRIVRWATILVPGGTCHVVRACTVPYLERLRLCNNFNAAAIEASSEEAASSALHATETLRSSADSGTQVEIHVVRGMPMSDLLTEVSRYHAQIVAVGRHEQSPHESVHTLMGSVGVRLAYHAPIDVLVVP